MFHDESLIADNLASIKNKISEYEIKYAREPGSVKLLAASKTQSIEKISAAYAAGQHLFGENYLQEALAKMDALVDKEIIWYFIGPIQRNKTRKIAERFDWVLSVANDVIAKRLNDQRPHSLPPLNICIQVNISDEDTKSGVKQNDIFKLAELCQQLPQIKLRGLMSIPAPTNDFAKAKHDHHQLFLLWEKLRNQYENIDTLSMGMSEDFEAAIAEGTTLVRIGTAIFGSRLGP